MQQVQLLTARQLLSSFYTQLLPLSVVWKHLLNWRNIKSIQNELQDLDTKFKSIYALFCALKPFLQHYCNLQFELDNRAFIMIGYLTLQTRPCVLHHQRQQLRL